MDFGQQSINLPRINVQIILVVDGKFEKIGSYNSSAMSPLPEIGEEIQIPKISQDQSSNEETVCKVVNRRHYIPLGNMFVPVVSLFVSLDCSWKP